MTKEFPLFRKERMETPFPFVLVTNNFQQILDKLLFFLYDLFYKIGVRHFLQFLQQNPRRKMK